MDDGNGLVIDNDKARIPAAHVERGLAFWMPVDIPFLTAAVARDRPNADKKPPLNLFFCHRYSQAVIALLTP